MAAPLWERSLGAAADLARAAAGDRARAREAAVLASTKLPSSSGSKPGPPGTHLLEDELDLGFPLAGCELEHALGALRVALGPDGVATGDQRTEPGLAVLERL